MKRCPECRRDYYDDTLLYCLDDGNALLEGPASGKSEPPASAGGQVGDEPQTAILHETAPSSDAPTRAQINTTDQTAILRTGAESEPQNSLDEATEKHRFSANRAAKPLIAALAAVAVLVGGFFGYRYFYSPDSDQINSIAVLPFTSTDGNNDSEYLSDGLAESIIYDLSKIPQLKVLPASTVFRYKGKETSPEAVASELGVRAVLVSRISQNGDDLTISTELIDTQQNKVIWGNRYARKVNDSLAIQKEISREISERLRLGLSGEQEKNLAKQETANPEAFQAYLKGRFYWNKREGGIEKGIEFFKKAIELDPNYALAWSGLADSYHLSVDYLKRNKDEEYPKAKAAAEKAIALDPDLAEAHTSLALILERHDKNYAEAEKEYLKAIELDPKYPTARHWYSRFLHFNLGRSEEALKEAKLAVELDPLSMAINVSYAEILAETKKYEESLRQMRKVQEMFPDVQRFYRPTAGILSILERYEEAFAVCRKIEKEDKNDFHNCMSLVFYRQGKYGESLSECEKLERKKNESAYQICFAYNYAKLGNKQKVYEIIESDKFTFPLDKAALYAILGDKDRAFEVLEQLLAEKDRNLFRIQNSDEFDNLKSDPRYDNLLKGIEAMKANKN